MGLLCWNMVRKSNFSRDHKEKVYLSGGGYYLRDGYWVLYFCCWVLASIVEGATRLIRANEVIEMTEKEKWQALWKTKTAFENAIEQLLPDAGTLNVDILDRDGDLVFSSSVHFPPTHREG